MSDNVIPPNGSGDGSETFERWYRDHHDRLLAQCVRFLRDRAAAEDVAQETLLRAWLGRDQMRERDLGAWLSVVARNLCISHIRRQKRAVPTEVLPETPDEAADPAHLVERLESRRAVRRAMREVGERHRSLLFRREIEGVDYEELSEELGLTPAGTRTVLFRARRVLRERLAAVGEGVGAFVFGVRLRARSWANNLVGPIDAIVAPMLQVAVAIALTGGIVLSSPAVASIASHASRPRPLVVSQRAIAHSRDVSSLPEQVQVRKAIAETPTGHLPVSPGLTPDGNLYPSVTGPGGHETHLGGIVWEPRDGPTPYPLYRRDGQSRIHITEAMLSSAACEEAPQLCW